MQQPYYPPPPKRRDPARIIGLTVAGILGLVLFGGCVAAVVDGGDDAGSTSATVAESSTPGRATPTSTPKVILTDRGDGGKSTKTFTVDGDWDLEYTYDCRDTYGDMGNFQIWNEETGLANTYVNDLGARGRDVAHQHLGGKLALKINTQCRWTINVVDV